MAIGFEGLAGESLMGDVVNIKIDTRELDRIAQGLNYNIDDVIGMLAHQLEGYAKSLAPVDTGALKNSIQSMRQSKGNWRVQDGVEYGIYQEMGTYKMAAQPFMIPSAEKVSKDLNDGKTWERIFK